MISPYYIDLLIILALGLYLLDGYRRGFVFSLFELIGTLAALYLAGFLTAHVGSLLSRFIHLPDYLQAPVNFLIIWLIIQTLIAALSPLLYHRIPESVRHSTANKILGLIPAFFKGLVMIALILTLAVSFSFQAEAINRSRLGNPLVTITQREQVALFQRYSKQISELVPLLTNSGFIPKVENENESLQLKFKTTQVSVDQASEQKMFDLVNRERVKVGEAPLKPSAELTGLARIHAKDMLARGYFAHVNPDGKDPFDRMNDMHITYLTAGENLAFAPTVDIAHVGLMNSPGHRANILDKEFGHLGVGVIDAGVYGKMFVQEFTD
jgi:uncharacterized protein YkwD